jgi:hypothetical protein
VRFLAVGEWIVARAEDGPLEAEYALFETSDVILSAAARGFGTREQSYLTTAKIARARLREAGIDDALLRESVDALRPLEPLARSPALAAIASDLEAAEAFQGGVFRANARAYDGAWIDLAAVARACDMDEAAVAMQLLHLAAVLDEVPPATPVRLLGGDDVKPGERSWRRVRSEFARELPSVLRAIDRPELVAAAADEHAMRAALAIELRTRAALSDVYRPRLHALASALAVEQAADVVVDSDLEVEPSTLIDELRSHGDMLRGDGGLTDVAQFLTALARASDPAADLAILAARAWLACGETAYARYFARRVLENDGASESAYVAAEEILGATSPTDQSMNPPPVRSMRPPPVTIIAVGGAAHPGASLPPTERIEVPPRSTRPASVEIVETMPAPAADTARIRMTELARALARDYRLAYGVTLQTDATAIEAMQRHLVRRAGSVKEDELARHGALLSEILARTLGAYWIDTSGAEVGRWSMIVPPSSRVWPVGRVHRFFQRGSADGDLVDFYRELEGAARAT